MEGDVETDAFPALGDDAFLLVVMLLPRQDLARALRVCKAWRRLLDETDSLWLAVCETAWAGKAYVPASLRALAEGAAAVQDAEQQERRDLIGLKVRDLVGLMRKLNVHGQASEMIEKGDFADAIISARSKAAEEGSWTHKLLRKPSLLVRDQRETFPKAALRLSLIDAQRTYITSHELQSFTFNVRLRHDGPLAGALRYDPWWRRKGCGEITFLPDGQLAFTWPPDPDNDGEPMDPFAAMGMHFPTGSLGWQLEVDGRVVRLLFNNGAGQGPQELVCRHPTTWGWVLYSQGTCWTSWPMPPCKSGVGEPVVLGDSDQEAVRLGCSDPLLREQALRELPCELQRDF